MTKLNLKMALLFAMMLLWGLPAYSGVTFLPTWLSDGMVGQPYDLKLTAQGGTPSYIFSISSGVLPAGLSLDSYSGQISGIPEVSGSFPITIRIIDAEGAIFTRSSALKVNTFGIISPNLLPSGTFGRFYSYTFEASPVDSYSWTATSLPQGLTLNPNTGVLSGTVVSPFMQAVSFPVTATLNGEAVTKQFTLFSLILQARDNLVGQNALPANAVIDTEYRSTLTVYGGTPPYSVSVIGKLPPGLEIAPDEKVQFSYNKPSGLYGWHSLFGVPSVAGNYSFCLRYEDSSGLVVDRETSLRVSGLTAITTNLPSAVYDTEYRYQLEGATSYQLADWQYMLGSNSLPPGLTLSSDGLISGTPRATGSFSFTIDFMTETDKRSQRFTNFYIAPSTDSTIRPAQFSVTEQPNILKGGFYRYAITPFVWGVPQQYKWKAIGEMPPGISLKSDADLPAGFSAPTAVLEGTPTTTGTFTFVIELESLSTPKQFGAQEVKMTITTLRAPNPTPDAFSGGPVLIASQGDFYQYSLLCINGVKPCTYNLNSATPFPPGLTLSSDGVISGIPTEAGSWNPTVYINDASGNSFRFQPAIEVAPAGIPISLMGIHFSVNLEDATLGSLYSFGLEDLLAAGRGLRPISWSLDSGSFPPGLSIVPGSASDSAALAGTPTALGNYIFTLVATDANGSQHLVSGIKLKVTGLNVSPADLPPAISGVPYSEALTVSGGTAPYQFRLSTGSDMPPGISLSSEGLLSGTPDVFTDCPFLLQIEAVDDAGAKFYKRYRFDVAVPSYADGTIPSAGGSASDLLWGSKAALSFPSDVLITDTDVAINVLEPSQNQPPNGFSSSSSYLVQIELTPAPSYPLSAPGATLTLPLLLPQVPGTVLDLFIIDPDTLALVAALDPAGNPIFGSVDQSGRSATFTGITHFSTFYAVEYGLMITGPVDPVQVNTDVTISATLNPLFPYESIVCDWGDGSSTRMQSTPGGVSASHSYSKADVYTVILRLYKGNLLVASEDFRYVVIYDPSAGFVTGGGWFISPPGSFAADPSLVDKANFGFVSKYLRGSDVPTGNAEFQFRAGNLDFRSTNFCWLVVAGAKATFKGTGRINGIEGFEFIISAIDGEVNGGGIVDRFRIKIYQQNGGHVVYDNLMHANDSADPTTALGGGSINIHKAK